jgi:acyl-CoA hydrolase
VEHYKLILPEHLNHHGNLFGGNMLKWIDELAYITANQEYPGHTFLTIALDNVVFRQAVSSGEIIRFVVDCCHLGHTSVQYHVVAYGTRRHSQPDQPLFETKITFVSVDDNGKKKEIRRP